MDDNAIVALFWARDEQALWVSAQKYGPYCHTVAYNIVRNRQDAEECVNDTWVQAWNAIPPRTPLALKAFLGTITRNLAINLYRASHTQRRGGGQVAVALEELGECVSPDTSPEAAVNTKELQQAINGFLKAQPPVRRQVFLRRYFYLEDIPAIAHRYGLKETNVRMMLSRTRQKLRKYLQQEGYIA